MRLSLPCLAPISLACLFCAFLTGCSIATTITSTPDSDSVAGPAVTGRVMGGQSPLVGAHLFLFTPGAGGYGNASTSMLMNVPGSTTLDTTPGDATIGDYYVTTGSNGAFSITNDYTCTANAPIYAYSVGGDSGSGANSAAALLAAGTCPSSGNLPSTLYVVVNEVSTIAAAYAMAGFATDALHVSSSGTPLAQTGIYNAFTNVGNLENISTGTAYTATPAGNGTVPQATINTLANILASCVNSTGPGSSACLTLFADARSGGATGTQPSDTATAAINLAHNPVANLAALYALSTATPPFAPALTAQPNDFTITLGFTAPGLPGRGIAIDGNGDVWVANQTSGFGNGVYNVTELSSSGSNLSGTTGYTAATLNEPYGIAIDHSGNAWVTNFTGSSVTKLSPSGANLSGSGGYTGTLDEPDSVAIDAFGSAWVTSFDLLLTEYSNTGAELSPGFEGYNGGGILEPASVAIDGSNRAWVANDGFLGLNATPAIAVFSGTGAPLTGSGITGGGLDDPTSIAMDSAGNAWISDYYSGVIEVNQSGQFLSGANGITGGGFAASDGIAIDGAGNVWVSNLTSIAITEVSNSGVVLSGPNGFTSGHTGGSTDVAVDGSGNVWAPSAPGVIEIIGAATPVITPICAGLPTTLTTGTSNLGTRP